MDHNELNWFYFICANEFDAKEAVERLTSKGIGSYRKGIRVFHETRVPDGLWRSIDKINTL